MANPGRSTSRAPDTNELLSNGCRSGLWIRRSGSSKLRAPGRGSAAPRPTTSADGGPRLRVAGVLGGEGKRRVATDFLGLGGRPSSAPHEGESMFAVPHSSTRVKRQLDPAGSRAWSGRGRSRRRRSPPADPTPRPRLHRGTEDREGVDVDPDEFEVGGVGGREVAVDGVAVGDHEHDPVGGHPLVPTLCRARGSRGRRSGARRR